MNIKLNDLKKTYFSKDGKIEAVNGISLEIPSNTIFGIIGKSGAGKSTLVRLISMLESPDYGEVFYGDERVDNLSKADLIQKRRTIGMIFQNFNLFSSRNAAQNVAYPLEICHYPREQISSRVQELLELVGLKDRALAPISTLSGGQKQRIAIARALAAKPNILFCDEATSALDPQTTHSILDLIRDIQKQMGLTVVMITHQMEVVRDACSQVAVLDGGKVVEQGRVTDIFSSPKSDVTKDFISRINGNQVELLRWSKDGGRFTLRFLGEDTGKAIISELCRTFLVEVNIRAGGIQHLSEKDVGTMILDIDGKEDDVQQAITWLKAKGVLVEDNKNA